MLFFLHIYLPNHLHNLEDEMYDDISQWSTAGLKLVFYYLRLVGVPKLKCLVCPTFYL